MPAKHARKPLAPKDLGRWHLVGQFQQRLEALCQRVGVHSSFEDPNRKLQIGHYAGLFLFGLLNPAVETMRALCEASKLEKIQREVCGRPVSLGSFSEAQDVIDPELLGKLFSELAEEVRGHGSAKPLSKGLDKEWLIVDSTLWKVLPRMGWAVWRKQGNTQNAVRLHLGLHLLEDKPIKARVTPGKGCERKALREILEPGHAYVGDRYYGEDYKLFSELEALGCAFVLRLRDEAVIDIDQELPLSEADRAARVIRSAWGHLGHRKSKRSMRVRLVWVQAPEEVLLLVTNQSPAQLEAELVAELYKRRWQVELFFRWIKCILGNRHWLAESARGVAIQIYLALIAALLLQFHIGERPNRRMMELIQLYLMGVATLNELEAGIERQTKLISAMRSKKRASAS